MKKILPLVFIFLVMLIWGTSYFVMKDTLNSISSGLLIFSRSFITFIVLLPFVLKDIKNLTRKNITSFVLTGIVVGLGYLTQAIGLKYTTPGKSAFLEDAYCVVVPILSLIIMKNKLRISNIISILLCIGGVILISLDSLNGEFGIGEILSLLAGIFYGINITLTPIFEKDINPITYTCGQFFTISIISGMYFLIFERDEEIIFNQDAIFNIIYLGVVVTALAWILRNYAQKSLSPVSVSIILPFSAVVGTIISVILKTDNLTIYLVIGGALITLSILIDNIFPLLKNKKGISVED